MIKAVLFDYGGVLTEAGRRGSIASIAAELFGLDLGWRKLDDLHDELRRGLISTEEFFLKMAERHKSEKILTAEQWNGASREVFVRSEPVYDLAAALRHHGVKTGILSNVYQMTADVLKHIGNYDGFEPLILSCEAKLAKPDPEIYQLAVSRLGVKPPDIIFVDDQTKCMPPAEEIGMHTVLAASPEQITADVEQILLRENGLEL